MTKIEQIEWAIHLAKQEKSKLTPEVLAMEGMSSPKVRHLYNNLGSLATEYLEIGSWKGASFISTMFGNEQLQGVAVDNWSEFNPDGKVSAAFVDNARKFINSDRWECVQDDCWRVKNLNFPPTGVLVPDLYLFDGGHSFEDHKKAVTHFFPMMADQFIFVVDDYSHPDFHAVKEGTLAGLSEVKDQYMVVKDWELWEEGEGSVRWWNGIGIFLIEKI